MASYFRKVFRPDLNTIDEWNSALKVAIIYEAWSVAELAIDELNEIVTPVERIVLGRKYPDQLGFFWLREGLVEACSQSPPLGIDEGNSLNIDDIIRIGRIRERKRGHGVAHIGKLIKEIFEFPDFSPSNQIWEKKKRM